MLCLNLNYLFQLFEWHACKLACVAKCMSTINKHLTFDLTFDLTFCLFGRLITSRIRLSRLGTCVEVSLLRHLLFPQLTE